VTNVFENGDGGEAAQLQTLMALFANVNQQMIDISIELRKKPEVSQARRESDLREYRDPFRFDNVAFYAFEAVLEVDAQDGSLICWLANINCTPSGWELERAISCRGKNSRDDVITTFPALSSQSFPEFASKVADAICDFIESARAYQFNEQQ